ncbi:D-glycero-beta-D-manno-heptose-7-phosphate kinase [Akkermansia sp. N21169]|uniref:D-glycero-beta-D-manno-heptose-7-phosphate kinase n=1 Tax=Akkermansia sp. N21169 TaxID=3040765 RepID=UPI00244EC1C4|nr:D-glycero-beta-D-manno-heptose-7-phosphate kinase [Akkermansia sp. N21169]MDH3067542.1 D-glycero-beta-D-manno-heptose-7-phosphate kinase [Akkermansia sp. N21169]
MSSLSRYIDHFSKAKILCIGDLMLDIFIYGSVNRVSPEAPVPVLLESREKNMLGGAGNVVANLRALGCQTFMAGIVGEDANGQSLRSYLDNLGADTRLLLEKKGYTTSVKTRYVAGNHHLLRVDKEEMLHLDSELSEQLLNLVDQCLPDMDIVLLSDYGKGFFDNRITPALIQRCRALKKNVIVDPKRIDYSCYRGAALVKPNLKEFIAAAGKELHPSDPDFEEQAVTCGQALCRKYDIGNLLVTLSEYGMIFIPGTKRTKPIRLATEAREVFDVSGAGDTSLAVLGAAMASGTSMKDAMKLANVASGIVVGKFGTACVTGNELKTQLSTTTSSRLLTVREAVKLTKSLQEQGKVVGFTNGCFDILHPGHLHSFDKARESCDVLFVGLNSDASVKRLKGNTRPINNEKSRAALLLALKSVDYVVIFNDDTALPLLKQLQPDVIAKEGYPLDRWPEGRYVVSYGGKALELPRIEGFSSTGIISKMNDPSC